MTKEELVEELSKTMFNSDKYLNILPAYHYIILHIPHSGEMIPSDFKFKDGIEARISTLEDIHTFSEYLIDYYTDELFSPIKEIKHVLPLVFPYNRCICDVERLAKDPLTEQGCGFMYSFDDKYYGRSEYNVIESIRIYNKHQEELRTALCYVCQPDAIRPNGEQTVLLLDCHSFSAKPTKLCPNPPADIDICLGFNDDWSKPKDLLIERVKQFFEDRGYRVALNTPFSNSKTVDIPLYYHSLMLEVNKSLYMNEDTRQKTEGFERLQNDLQDLYANLLTDYKPIHPSQADIMLGYCDTEI